MFILTEPPRGDLINYMKAGDLLPGTYYGNDFFF
jgi:hypothetical protein